MFIYNGCKRPLLVVTSSNVLEGARVLRPRLCLEYTRSRLSTHSHRRCASATCAARADKGFVSAAQTLACYSLTCN